MWLLVEISARPREEKRRKWEHKGHLALGTCSTDCFTGNGDSWKFSLFPVAGSDSFGGKGRVPQGNISIAHGPLWHQVKSTGSHNWGLHDETQYYNGSSASATWSWCAPVLMNLVHSADAQGEQSFKPWQNTELEQEWWTWWMGGWTCTGLRLALVVTNS